MVNVFDSILEMSSVEAGNKSKASIEWFREKASNRRLTANTLLRRSRLAI